MFFPVDMLLADNSIDISKRVGLHFLVQLWIYSSCCLAWVGITYLQRKGGAAGLPRHPHWDGDTRILTHSPAHNVTCQAEYEDHMDQIKLVVLCTDNAVWRYHPGYLYPGIHGNHLAAWGSALIEAFLGVCAPFEGPCPRSWSKSTTFATSKLSSPDAYVYTRPVARESWGSEYPLISKSSQISWQ